MTARVTEAADTLRSYDAARAAEHDRVCDKPERQADLSARRAAFLRGLARELAPGSRVVMIRTR